MTDAYSGSGRSLAEEAARLIETLGVLAGQHRVDHACQEHQAPGRPGPADGAGAAAGLGGLDGLGAAPECRLCPICRVIAGVRSLRPEVLAHLVAAGEELLAAAREFVAATGAPAGSSSATAPPAPSGPSADGPDGGLPESPESSPASPRPRIERIELD